MQRPLPLVAKPARLRPHDRSAAYIAPQRCVLALSPTRRCRLAVTHASTLPRTGMAAFGSARAKMLLDCRPSAVMASAPLESTWRFRQMLGHPSAHQPCCRHHRFAAAAAAAQPPCLTVAAQLQTLNPGTVKATPTQANATTPPNPYWHIYGGNVVC